MIESPSLSPPPLRRDEPGGTHSANPVDTPMRRVLIISPHFPPVNAADMHRVRQSLPYFREYGWEPVVLAADPDVVEGYTDEALLETIPADTEVHRLPALDYHWTRKLGLGNLGLRMFWWMMRAGSRLLARRDFDLVYFSTTVWPVVVLGAYWKRRFGVPFVVDMQDPWFNEWTKNRPKEEHPPKYWFAYRLNRATEPVAMKSVDGIVSVSQAYCDTLTARYPNVRPERCRVIPFGGASVDFEVLDRLPPGEATLPDGATNVVYVGRGGHDMAQAARALFGALADGLAQQPRLYEQVRLHFIGTDYAAAGKGKKTIEPLAAAFGPAVAQRVEERPARVPYFEVLRLLQEAAMLVIPGSMDPAYTASKLYPYILAQRPLLAIFNETSSVVDVLRQTGAGEVVTFAADEQATRERVHEAWTALLERLPFTPDTDWDAFAPYTARTMTERQVELFDQVVGSRTPVPAGG